jgi:hypothetical protein
MWYHSEHFESKNIAKRIQKEKIEFVSSDRFLVGVKSNFVP